MKRLWRCIEDQFSASMESIVLLLFGLVTVLLGKVFVWTLSLAGTKQQKQTQIADIDNAGGLAPCVIKKQKPSLVASKVN